MVSNFGDFRYKCHADYKSYCYISLDLIVSFLRGEFWNGSQNPDLSSIFLS